MPTPSARKAIHDAAVPPPMERATFQIEGAEAVFDGNYNPADGAVIALTIPVVSLGNLVDTITMECRDLGLDERDYIPAMDAFAESLYQSTLARALAARMRRVG